MSGKTRAEVFIQPKNRRPLKRTAAVFYADNAELRRQLEAYAGTVWITAKKIIVDTHAREIIVDSVSVANYRLHIPGQAVPDQIVPTKPIRGRRRYEPATGRNLARHTLAQLAVITAGLLLTLAAGPILNAVWLGGFALAGFGLYRVGLGVQRREAIR